MKKDKIFLSEPHLSGNEALKIKSVLEKSNYDSYNEVISDFEGALENYIQEDTKVACLSSGTAAIHLALILAGVERDDEVLCQSFTYFATVNPVLYQGAKPVFIDSEPDTWNMCPDKLEKAIQEKIRIGKKPKAIIVVHLYGMPAKIDLILSISKKYEITLIEDAAEAFGSRYKGRLCGTFGDFGILSFNNNKIITTFGGGALLCKDEELKRKAVFFATQSRDDALHYQHSNVGYNYRMSPISAIIGIEQLKLLDSFVKKRRDNNDFYRNLFSTSSSINTLQEPDNTFFSNHWLTCITSENKDLIDKLRNHCKSEHIETRSLWKPMHLQPIFKDSGYFGGTIAENLFKSGLCLPSGSNMTIDDKDRLSKSLHAILG